MRKVSGKISKTVAFGIFYLVLNLALLVANHFGYGQFAPSSDLEAILGGLAALLVIALRYYTEEPMA